MWWSVGWRPASLGDDEAGPRRCGSQEISHTIDHYEREREGLGAEFWDELRAAMRTLEAPGPECGPVIGLPSELGVRRKLLARFPYAIVFVEAETHVRVISVMHGHRRPAYWRRRI